MSDTDPLAGTTIGPDGNRVPVDAAGNPITESEQAIIHEGDALADATEPTTAEDVGYGTVPDAANSGDPLESPAAEAAHEEREASGSQAEEQQGSGPTDDGAAASEPGEQPDPGEASTASSDANPGEASPSGDANPGEASTSEAGAGDANPSEGGDQS